jgi:enoyl-CoA hydratase/carnithine racemase
MYANCAPQRRPRNPLHLPLPQAHDRRAPRLRRRHWHYNDAKIGFVFSRRGLIMEACSSFFLPRLVGHSRAMKAITTGATYLASDKVWDGLFSELVDKPEDVLPKALEVAEDVVRNTSSVSTYLMKELMYRDAGSPEGQHLLDSRVIYELFGSP